MPLSKRKRGKQWMCKVWPGGWCCGSSFIICDVILLRPLENSWNYCCWYVAFYPFDILLIQNQSWSLKAIGASCNVCGCYCNVQCAIKSNRCFVQKSANDDFATTSNRSALGFMQGCLSIGSLYFFVLGQNLILALNFTQDPNNQTAEMETFHANSSSPQCSFNLSSIFSNQVVLALFPAFFGWESILQLGRSNGLRSGRAAA